MLVANVGLRGVDVVAEVYEHLEAAAESFFDRGVDSRGKLLKDVSTRGCLHVTRNEMAVVDLNQQTWVQAIGTSGLDASVALFIVSSELCAAGVVHVNSVDAAIWAAPKLARAVGESKSSPKSSSEDSSDAPFEPSQTACSATRRKASGPLLEAYIVGGFKDPEGRCEDIIRAMIHGLSESEHRIRLQLVCAGLVNDSQHNGNEEDRRGPQCALVTACVIYVRRSKSGVAGPQIRFEAVPVPGFQDRGPAFVLRCLRTMLGERKLAEELLENNAELKRARPQKRQRMLGKALVVQAFSRDTGQFLVPQFRFTQLDRQTMAILLHMAERHPQDFLMAIEAGHIAPANQLRVVADACEVLRLLLRHPQISPFFPGNNIPLVFEMSPKINTWVPSSVVMPSNGPEISLGGTVGAKKNKKQIYQKVSTRDRDTDMTDRHHPHRCVWQATC